MNDKIDIELAEDEDLARAKAWWKENGSSIIGGVLIGTVMVFGYKYWQTYQENHAHEVAQLYEKYSQTPQDSVALDSLLAVDDTAVYAQLGRLTAAKEAVDAGQFDQAEQLLNSVLESKIDDGLRSIAILRLATIFLANGKQDAALELLEKHANSELSLMQARREELMGDIYLQKGDGVKAKEYYESSINSLTQTGQAVQLVQLKLDNL